MNRPLRDYDHAEKMYAKIRRRSISRNRIDRAKRRLQRAHNNLSSTDRFGLRFPD